MSTYLTGNVPFAISTSPGIPTVQAQGCVFGVDRFSILILRYTPTVATNGMVGPIIKNANAPTAPNNWAFFCSRAVDVGGGVIQNEYLIPQPVGTGAVRGVPFRDIGGTTRYITCTQTVPA